MKSKRKCRHIESGVVYDSVRELCIDNLKKMIIYLENNK
tara:strand:+ start:272 stop:388 length:117 start_codon:yes stop_codon:yes gene_type:complete